MLIRFISLALGIGTLVSSLAFAQVPELNLRFINAEEVLLSPEYTFQDQTMVNEPGRMTMNTPHKLNKAKAMSRDLLAARGLKFETSSRANLEAFKAGYYIQMGPDEEWYVDSEPVCIEVNHTPRNIFGVAEVSPMIFSAARKNKLVPYVNPAAERSGMGHVHVGGEVLGESPFYRFPNLLRNVMAYFHKHPSLLWGFAEAYDIGPGSNMESSHLENRQAKLAKAIASFDSWWSMAPSLVRTNGLQVFLRLLMEHGGDEFFEHYRAINIQHLRDLVAGKMTVNPKLTGKLTVELRGFRPPRSPETLTSELVMLLKLFDHLADPNLLVEMADISPDQYALFHAASTVQADWQNVKQELGLNDMLLDGMIEEYVNAVHRQEFKVSGVKGAQVFAAYSPKGEKGTYFEVRIPSAELKKRETVRALGRDLYLERMMIEGTAYQVGLIKTTLEEAEKIINRGLFLRLKQLQRGAKTPQLCIEALVGTEAI